MRLLIPRGVPRATAAACAAMALALAWLHFGVLDRDLAQIDDGYFAVALDDRSLWTFLGERYLTWSGRLPIDALSVLLMNHVWIWRIGNVGMVLLLCACVAKLGFGERLSPAAGLACAFALLWCMPPPVLHDGAWWVSGSFNYLWPAASGLYALQSMFDVRPRAAWRWVLPACAAGFAAYAEQVAIALFLIGVPRAAWWARSQRVHAGHVAILACLSINAAINFGAPGAQARFDIDLARFFPDYDTLGLVDKLHLALGLVAGMLTRSSNFLAMLLVGATAALLVHAPMARGLRIALLAGLAALACAWLLPILTMPIEGWGKRIAIAGVSAANGAAPMRSVALAVASYGVACLVVGVGVALRAHCTRHALWVAWALAVGLATLAALAFSPTVYSSGSRIRFVACIALLVATCHVLGHVRVRFGERVFERTMAFAAIVAVLRILSEGF